MVSATMPPRPDGLVLAPFRALRYAPTRPDLGIVLAPPYDVIDAAERESLLAASPDNVVRLTLPDVSAGPQGYATAAQQLAAWRADGTLHADAVPSLTVYEQEVDGHRQRGLLGAIGLTPPEDLIVLPHENTMAGPVSDRLALMQATEADLEPIFLVYDGGGAASECVAGVDEQRPDLSVTTPDGAHHRCWVVTDSEQLAAVAADLHPRRAVIADGHHRYATFLRYQQERHDAGDGAGPWDLGLAFLVDGTTFGPAVKPIHRAVPALSASHAVELAREAPGLEVTEIGDGVAGAEQSLREARPGHTRVVLSDATRAWAVTVTDPQLVADRLPGQRSAAWRALDVAMVHAYLVSQVWDLHDDERTVTFHHDVASALDVGRRGGTALLLNPTPVSAVAAVAAQAEPMPRKSTLFVPKPATGIVIRSFADA